MLPDPAKNRFPIEESPTEMAWVQLIGPLVTAGLGGLFPERSDELPGIYTILDIGCGTGEWALSVASKYPGIQVTGIDISERMMNDANAHARARGFENARFRVMDATQPFDFPGGSFDLVSARGISGFMNPELWPKLLLECRRILRPGGTFRITELSEPLTNSAASGKLWGLFAKSHSATRRTFDPEGRHIGVVHQLPKLLRDAGFQNTQIKGHGIDYSAGTPAWEGWYQNFSVVFKLMKPFFMKLGIASEEEFERLYQQMLADMLSDQFTGLALFFTFWGTTPEE